MGFPTEPDSDPAIGNWIASLSSLGTLFFVFCVVSLCSTLHDPHFRGVFGATRITAIVAIAIKFLSLYSSAVFIQIDWIWARCEILISAIPCFAMTLLYSCLFGQFQIICARKLTSEHSRKESEAIKNLLTFEILGILVIVAFQAYLVRQDQNLDYYADASSWVMFAWNIAVACLLMRKFLELKPLMAGDEAGAYLNGICAMMIIIVAMIGGFQATNRLVLRMFSISDDRNLMIYIGEQLVFEATSMLFSGIMQKHIYEVGVYDDLD